MLVHLMLELYGCDRQLLSNQLLVRRVLDEYPARVEMEKVSPVHLYQIETSNPLDAGLGLCCDCPEPHQFTCLA